MDTPTSILCEHCGSEAPIVMIQGFDNAGIPLRWPKSTMRGRSLYVFIACPQCGKREQCVASAGKADENFK